MESNKFKINWASVPSDPILHLYKQVKNNIDESLLSFFSIYFNKYQNHINQQSDCINKALDIESEIERKFAQENIKGKKIQNKIIFGSRFVLVGFLFNKTYGKNKRIISDFENFKNNQEALIAEIENKGLKYSNNYYSKINGTSIYSHVANSLGIEYTNGIYKKIADLYYQKKDFIGFTNSLIFRFKNTPVVNVLSKHLRYDYVITSNTMSFSYTEFETYTDHEGKTQTRTVYKTEVLTATHSEWTPFIEEHNKLYVLTNFAPELNFWNNSKKYLDFENDDFAKKYKIMTNKETVDESILQFFTIRAQELYLEWLKYEDLSKIDLNKKSWYFEINLKNSKLIESTNSYFSLIHMNDKKTLIEKTNNRFINDAKNYFEELVTSVSRIFLSPAINREWYEENKNYKISVNNLGEHKPINTIIDLNYILSKVFKVSSLNFLLNTPKRLPWIEIINQTNTSDGFIDLEIQLNSFDSMTLIDYVTVYGVHVGMKVIPVNYEKFTPISENKRAYVLIKNKNLNIPNFYINKTLNDLTKINEKENDFWVSDSEWESKKNQRTINILNSIIDYLDEDISVEITDEAFVILDNATILKDSNIEDSSGIIDIIKKLLKEINDL